MKKQKWFLAMLAVLIALLTVPAILSTTTVEAATIKLSKKKVTLVKGQKFKLKVKGTKKKVKWSSSKKSVATVSSKGVVKAKKKGKATITAKVGGKKLKCKVTVTVPKQEVNNNHNTSIRIEESKNTLAVGESIDIWIQCQGWSVSYDVSNVNIECSWGNWDSNNRCKLNVKGQFKGNTVLTVYDTIRPEIKDTITITVTQPVDSVYFSSTERTMVAGETYAVYSSVWPSDANNKKLNWTSSNTKVATVDQSGVVTAIGRGTATITAKAHNGRSASCTITVKDIDVVLPDLPKFIDEKKSDVAIRSTCLITDINLKKEYMSYSDQYILTLVFNGIKTYSDQGDNISSPCVIGYKLYDSDDVVVSSGTVYTTSVAVDDKFREEKIILDLSEGEYRLELLDVR